MKATKEEYHNRQITYICLYKKKLAPPQTPTHTHTSTPPPLPLFSENTASTLEVVGVYIVHTHQCLSNKIIAAINIDTSTVEGKHSVAPITPLQDAAARKVSLHTPWNCASELVPDVMRLCTSRSKETQMVFPADR